MELPLLAPWKLAEYLAAGLPVIAPRVAQCTERLRDGVDAPLVTPGDTSALAEALEHLRADPAARAALGLRARAAAERGGSWGPTGATNTLGAPLSAFRARTTRTGRISPHCAWAV
jgi:hypothetical protein